MRICFSCQTAKPETEFYRSKATRDGLQSQCRSCQAIRKRDPVAFRTGKLKPKESVETPRVVEAVKTLPEPKPAPKRILEAHELIVDIPGIYEVENLGRGYTSFRFESPVDGSVFSFESFKDRQSMMDAFRQQAIYAATLRQSESGRPAASETDEE